MAKYHTVNDGTERLHWSANDQVKECGRLQDALNPFKWFSDWAENVVQGKMSRFFQYLTTVAATAEAALSSDDSQTLWIMTSVQRHKLSHDRNYRCNMTQFEKGTLDLGTGQESLTFRKCPEGGAVASNARGALWWGSCRLKWSLFILTCPPATSQGTHSLPARHTSPTVTWH